MSEQKYDVIVIGTGPGGEGAAMTVAKDGQVDSRAGAISSGRGRLHALGDDSLQGPAACHQPPGRVQPSLLVSQHRQARAVFPIGTGAHRRIGNFSAVSMRHDFYDRNQAQLIHGRAHFLDSHTVELRAADGRPKLRLSADAFVIATGSRPYGRRIWTLLIHAFSTAIPSWACPVRLVPSLFTAPV